MKKSRKVFVVVTLFFLGFTSQAQIFGVKGAVGLANISSPNEIVNARFGRTLGARIGGTIEFDITDNLYIGSGLGFAKKGASTTGDNINLYYVELPAGARYDILEIGNSGYLYASAGLNLGILAFANSAGEKLNVGNSNGDVFKGIDLGFSTGVGVIFDDRFEVGLLTEFGLPDISTSTNTVIRNLALMVSFGYKFGM